MPKNLPDLEFLDLAYNDLNEFDFASFDQVGTLSSFKVNASHNEIPKLWINSTTFTPPTTSESVIKYFRRVSFNAPKQVSLSHLNESR